MMTDYETKVILSADDESFDQGWREMQTYLEGMGVARIEASIDRMIPEYRARYDQ